jgi:hypothetical protein
VLFTFPSRYWFTIAHSRVFSLTGWFRQIPAEFLVLRGTQDLPHAASNFDYRALTFYGWRSHAILLFSAVASWVLQPQWQCHWFGLFPFRSPLLRKSRLFSFPPGTKMFQFSGLASSAHAGITGHDSSWVAPFGYPRIKGYFPLPVAFRR